MLQQATSCALADARNFTKLRCAVANLAALADKAVCFVADTVARRNLAERAKDALQKRIAAETTR